MTGPNDVLSSGDEPAPDELDVLLTKAAYAVDGVTEVFSSAAIGQMRQVVAALATGETERLNRVSVTSHGTHTAIDARIGVDSAASAALAARGVADALLELAPAEGEVSMSVQVSRISDRMRGSDQPSA